MVIYLVLGILYESFVHPLTILSGLPFAGFGALLALVIFQQDLSIYAFVGIIMLIGIVKKNAIMMIDFAIEAERNHGKTARESILEAASVRFRPIMMTTMAALVGTLPIALGHGAGAESRRPLGIAVVGGLAFSQIITLYITPVIYTYLDALQQRFGRREHAKERERERAPELAPDAAARVRTVGELTGWVGGRRTAARQSPYSASYFSRKILTRGRWSGGEPVTTSIRRADG